MSYYADHTPDGRIVWAGTLPAPHLDPGLHRVQCDTLPLPDRALVVDGAVVWLSPQPTPAHTFNYTTKTWELNEGLAWQQARARRDELLARSDWVALRAADRGEPVPSEWLAYRQALRDVTEQADPLAIVWPVAPAA